MLSAALTLLMQVGPNSALSPAPAIPPELYELRERQRAQNADIAPIADRLRACLLRAEADGSAARIEADAWLEGAGGLSRAHAFHCRGYAEANMAQWADSARSFVAARDSSDEVDTRYRARLGAMAGAALLTAGNSKQALTVLNQARSDAADSRFPLLVAEIEIDRARAFVGEGDDAAAFEALEEARAMAPGNAQAWLLSATLSRRTNDLRTAQSQIEQANRLDPMNPGVGLEAGVIAVLLGNDEAARRSWQSVVTIAPKSVQAQSAKNYLEQLAQP